MVGMMNHWIRLVVYCTILIVSFCVFLVCVFYKILEQSVFPFSGLSGN